MYLSRLEIQGFKSFAEKTVLKFDKGNAGVVGPNGSGKSNIADAVRWCLGEQSLKLLRGKKSEDVIFSGSDTRPAMSLGEVTITLNNDDGRIPIEAAEVAITRRLYRSGESEYLINGAPSRLLDIVELLAKAGFGQKTYSVIGQGMIDTFITASPAERKLLFEEAAGVKQYQLKRNITLHKLETTQKNLQRVRDLLNELSPRLKSLERQAKRAVKREEVQKELTARQIVWYSFLIDELKTQLKEKNAALIETEQRVKEQEQLVFALEEKLRAGTSTGSNEQKEYEKLQQQLELEQKQKNEIESELARLSGMIEVEQSRDYSQDQKTLSSQKRLFQEEASTLRQEVQALEAEIANHKKTFDIYHKALSNFDEEAKRLRNDIAKMQRSSGKESVGGPEIRHELRETIKNQQDLIEKLTRIEDLNELKMLKEQAEDIRDRLEELATRLNESGTSFDSSQLIALQNELNQALHNKQEQVADSTKTEIALRSAQANHELKAKRLATLEGEIASIDAKLGSGASKEGNVNYLQDKQKKLEAGRDKINQDIIATRNALAGINQKEAERKQTFLSLEKDLQKKQIELNRIHDEATAIQVATARLETKKEDLDREINENLGHDKLRALTPEERETIATLDDVARNAQRQELEKMKMELARLGGADEMVIEEHQEVKERFEFLMTQSEDLTKASLDLRKVIEQLDKTIRKQFNEAFRKINIEFDKAFKVLFNGGQAKLIILRPETKTKEAEEMEDAEAGTEVHEQEEDLDEEAQALKSSIAGVEIRANPPGKKMKSLSMLSGGEKAMTAIALLSAIIANNPSPFVVLDEVDAALDEANSRRFAKIISSLSGRTQFITITHNRETMRQAKVLYGVTMQRDGVSTMLSIRLEDVSEEGQLKQEVLKK